MIVDRILADTNVLIYFDRRKSFRCQSVARVER